ncbi:MULTISPECIES: MerR family transcriptional regulator [Roseateles]|uniref:MerR family transcriptional regulator n=1 Tax=Pelomonas caseinilytica TaxID=2906763 RepID=A0ABS8X9Q5_9BURK|nr:MULTISPECIES: MerR family transcriptional regulator [unclassified Roseateles]MCE4535870.1 MerR family transcriptional regulator [Pelomonas sp. P7]HEV6966654.1 MerR family transcriptional regulator [Roseateles sp.]
MEKALPAIPAKRYFTIGEVSELCGVKPYVLRYWEQEFTQLKPMKRRGNRRYYQHHEVLLIRRIRDLLYDQGFTISGARNQLSEGLPPSAVQNFRDEAEAAQALDAMDSSFEADDDADVAVELATLPVSARPVASHAQPLKAAEVSLTLPVRVVEPVTSLDQVRAELLAIRASLLG